MCVCEQAELKALQERLDIDKQHWEENYKKKEVCQLRKPVGVDADQTETCFPVKEINKNTST